jgi:ligand-binding SRPBCC domain-containing protein
MIRIEDETEIGAPIHFVFDAERNISLHAETQKCRGEIAVGGVTSGLIELNQEVEWEAVHFGVRQRLRVRITKMERPFYFRDDMIKGAFSTMSHEHFFIEAGPNRTIKRDVFCFSAPLGILGQLAETLFLRAYMTRFLKAKNREFKQNVESQV